ncbi:MAG: hypothetical protein MdMp024_1319 [Bacteroidales bacterium]
MKTMVRLIYVVTLLVFSLSLSAQKKEVPKEMLGSWSYSMEDPQSGQMLDGTCTIKQNKGETKAYIHSGPYIFETTAFRPNDNGKFYADAETHGNPLTLSFYLIDKTTLSCEADAGSFVIPVEMKKAEKKK